MAKKPAARNTDLDQVLARLEALELRLARLEAARPEAAGAPAARAAAPEVALAPGAPAAPPAPGPLPTEAVAASASAPAAEASASRDAVPEDVLLVLSAAVAAFLGERAHIRQVRLVHSDAWAQQGRVAVMASHRWAVHR